MTKQDIDTIIQTICSNDENYEKHIISPKYLKKELEQIAVEQDIFGNDMTVGEAISILSYGTDYFIKGSYSGKIYHRSWTNNKNNAEKYYRRTVSLHPFFAEVKASKDGQYCRPVIGIWMSDYDMCKKE